MSLLENANAAVRLMVELCAIAALGFWAFQASDAVIMQWSLGLGAPLAAAFAWAAFVVPKAPFRLRDHARLVLEVTVFGGVVVALGVVGSPALATTLAAAFVVTMAPSTGVSSALKEEGRLRRWRLLLRLCLGLGAAGSCALTVWSLYEYETCDRGGWFDLCGAITWFSVLFATWTGCLALAAIFVRYWYVFIGFCLFGSFIWVLPIALAQ